jgi:hypothetical protein
VRLACVKADRARALLQVAGGADFFCNFALVAVAAPDLQNVLVRSWATSNLPRTAKPQEIVNQDSGEPVMDHRPHKGTPRRPQMHELAIGTNGGRFSPSLVHTFKPSKGKEFRYDVHPN